MWMLNLIEREIRANIINRDFPFAGYIFTSVLLPGF